MDKPERETRDLMNVESFSQLPFIRPSSSSAKEKSSSSSGGGGAIRLFGKEFTTESNTNNRDGAESTDKDHQTSSTTADNNNNTTATTTTESIIANSSSSRKFECHYCCRNFPTSQALGGHQNAHKRERQHAKRAHLQSHGPLDPHDYGLMAYGNRPIDYQYHHSWNSSPYTRQHYGYNGTNHIVGHQPSQPINGSPLATWRVPTSHSSFLTRHTQIINSSAGSRDLINRPVSGGSLGAQGRLVYETKGGMQDHVSLDLHL